MKKFILSIALIAALAVYAKADPPYVRIFSDTAASLTALNPVLSPGDIAFETDTHKLKVCPGPNAEVFNSLSYATTSGAFATVSATTGSFTNINTSATITAATVVATRATTTTCAKGFSAVTVVGGLVTSATCSL